MKMTVFGDGDMYGPISAEGGYTADVFDKHPDKPAVDIELPALGDEPQFYWQIENHEACVRITLPASMACSLRDSLLRGLSVLARQQP